MKDYLFNNPDLYPTSEDTFNRMAEGLTIEGKVVYDPEAGTGNLVRFCQERGAKQVIASEINEQLCKILQTKCTLIGKDFLQVTSDQISHVDVIVMNPPFSQGAEHINHAYKIAPPGCKITALCNLQTLTNAYSKSREELKANVEGYGSYQDIGDCFSQGERKTDVKVALIRLEKPGTNYNQEFEGFFTDEDPAEQQANGLIGYNVIREIVNRYVESVKIFDQQLETAVRLSEMTGEFYGGSFGMQVTRNKLPLERNEFKKGMQKAGWNYIFSKLNLTKHTTRGLKEDINKFVETQENIPFTMRNIYKMLEIVYATTGQRMDKAIVEVFDTVTKHHADNKYGIAGFKTNSHYLLTKRFILPTSNENELLSDMQKALCYITGENYSDHVDLALYLRYPNFLIDEDGKFINKYDTDDGTSIKMCWHDYEIKNGYPTFDKDKHPSWKIVRFESKRGEWFDWSFFRVKWFKNGNKHFEFKDEKVWANFNQRVAKIKGFPLPEKKEQTKYQERQNGRQATQAAYRPTAQKPVVLSTIKL